MTGYCWINIDKVNTLKGRANLARVSARQQLQLEAQAEVMPDSKEQRASFLVSLSYSTPTPTPTVSGCVVYSGNRLKTIIVPTLRSLCRCQLQKTNAKMAKRARRQWTNEMSWHGLG